MFVIRTNADHMYNWITSRISRKESRSQALQVFRHHAISQYSVLDRTHGWTELIHQSQRFYKYIMVLLLRINAGKEGHWSYFWSTHLFAGHLYERRKHRELGATHSSSRRGPETCGDIDIKKKGSLDNCLGGYVSATQLKCKGAVWISSTNVIWSNNAIWSNNSRTTSNRPIKLLPRWCSKYSRRHEPLF